MAACFSCVGSGQATPATAPPTACPRCGGSAVEPAAVGTFRVDVVSVADPDRPFFVACFEAVSRPAALAVAELVVAEQASNPELHYGDLYEYVAAGDRPARLEYLGSIEPPAPASGDVAATLTVGSVSSPTPTVLQVGLSIVDSVAGGAV